MMQAVQLPGIYVCSHDVSTSAATACLHPAATQRSHSSSVAYAACAGVLDETPDRAPLTGRLAASVL